MFNTIQCRESPTFIGSIESLIYIKDVPLETHSLVLSAMHPHSLSHAVSKPQGHSPLWPAISSYFQGLANLFFEASLHPPLTTFQ